MIGEVNTLETQTNSVGKETASQEMPELEHATMEATTEATGGGRAAREV